MDSGADPGPDGGLPPAGIEIPDDARELDRDVLAYRREMRARRRRARIRRLLAPLRGHAMVMPLIAACVALSMLGGTLLPVLTASPGRALVPGHPGAPSRPAASAPAPPSSASPPIRTSPGALPRAVVLAGGRPTPLHDLVTAVLALVPARCQCSAALRQLAAQAADARVRVFFVGTGQTMPEVTRLARQDGGGRAVAVNDTGNALGSAYHPAGLTAVLVHSDAAATVRRDLVPGFRLEAALRALQGPGASHPPGRGENRPGGLTAALTAIPGGA